VVRRALILLAVLSVATGCDEEFKPASRVGGLRVLGARAEPAEIQPGKVAQLEALVVDPTRAAKPTVFWIACDPDPFNQGRTACTDTATFEDPSSIDLSSGSLPPGMKFIGLGDRAAYAAPATLFDVLAADDPIRQEGTVALILILVVGEEVSPLAPQEELAAVFARVRNDETPAIIALFRVLVSEDPVPNQNPRFGAVRYGDEEPLPEAHLLFGPEEKRQLVVAATDDSYESYLQLGPTGVEQKSERMQVAWFSTSGSMSKDVLALDSELNEEFTAPGFDPQDLVPENRRGMTWAVLRDSRGGITWRAQPFYSCSSVLFSHPLVTAVRSPTAPGELLVLEGEGLAGIVDVVLNGVVVKGSYSAARGTWEGEPKGVASGTWPLELRSADCTAGPENLTVTIP
jgi:hypothetical protein